MKLLLDEHVSPSVSEALRAKSYDVKAVAESTLLRGLDDDEILHQATADRRAVVTRNFADFLAVSVDWASSKREHFGIVLVSAAFSVVESARTSKSSRLPLDPIPTPRRYSGRPCGPCPLRPVEGLSDAPTGRPALQTFAVQSSGAPEPAAGRVGLHRCSSWRGDAHRMC